MSIEKGMAETERRISRVSSPVSESAIGGHFGYYYRPDSGMDRLDLYHTLLEEIGRTTE